MARRPVARRDFAESGLLAAAALHRMRAARVEMAARRPVYRRRNLTRNRGEVMAAFVERRDFREQRPGVRVIGVIEQLQRRRGFDYPAQVHDDDAVG